MHLASWVRRQRRDKKKLSQRQIDLLNKLGFIWRLNRSWKDSFDEFVLLGIIDYPTKQGTLGRWVVSNRNKYKKWKERRMSVKERKRWEPKFHKLNSIGFYWEMQEHGRGSGDADDGNNDESTGDGESNDGIEDSQEGSDETEEPEEGEGESSDSLSEP
jgi:hypothetical protein